MGMLYEYSEEDQMSLGLKPEKIMSDKCWVCGQVGILSTNYFIIAKTREKIGTNFCVECDTLFKRGMNEEQFLLMSLTKRVTELEKQYVTMPKEKIT
jgi:hypothetical protein